jgi:hypothetical protein
MNKIVMAGLAAGVAALSGVPGAHAGMQWVNATVPSCDNTCHAAGMQPVISGYYGNGEPFYVCAGNANGEGLRAGYNLRPSWANACTVGWGGHEIPVNPYVCLCQ